MVSKTLRGGGGSFLAGRNKYNTDFKMHMPAEGGSKQWFYYSHSYPTRYSTHPYLIQGKHYINGAIVADDEIQAAANITTSSEFRIYAITINTSASTYHSSAPPWNDHGMDIELIGASPIAGSSLTGFRGLCRRNNHVRRRPAKVQAYCPTPTSTK